MPSLTNFSNIPMKKIIDLLYKDSNRLQLLKIVSTLCLPDCYIAAGFVRNMVWDHLHGIEATTLNDVDVIYFSKEKINESAALKTLTTAYPNVNWQLKNQAFMHERNGDQPYKNSMNAMAYWPEIETAIGMYLNDNDEIIVASPFDIQSIFNGFITHNTNREKSVFLKRIQEKKWLETWPTLKVKL
jgi:hypothetical protein